MTSATDAVAGGHAGGPGTDRSSAARLRRPAGPGVARPRPGHRAVQPEGRRRQDDDHDEPGRCAGRVRPQGAPGRLRPAGRAVSRPRRAPRGGRAVAVPAAGRPRRRRPRASSADHRRSRASTCCPPTSTCRRPRCTWSPRSPARWCSSGCCGPLLDDYDVVLIDCQPSPGPARGQRADRRARRADPGGVRVLRPARRRPAAADHREGHRPAELRSRDRRRPADHVRPAHPAQPRGRGPAGGRVRRQGLPHRHRPHREVPRLLRRLAAHDAATPPPTRAPRPTASWPASWWPGAWSPEPRGRPGGASRAPRARRADLVLRGPPRRLHRPFRPAAGADRQAPPRRHRGRPGRASPTSSSPTSGPWTAWDLDEVTGFVLVAATLLDLKAARLLPGAQVEDEQDLALLEARDLLFARLLQYRAFRTAAARHRATGSHDVAGRHPRRRGDDPAAAGLLPGPGAGPPTRASFARSAAEALAPQAGADRGPGPPARPRGQRRRAAPELLRPPAGEARRCPSGSWSPTPGAARRWSPGSWRCWSCTGRS